MSRLTPSSEQQQPAKALQSLLTARYKLAFHHETKDAPSYALVVAKDGPRFDRLTPFRSPEHALSAHPTPQDLMPIGAFNTQEGGRMFLEKTDMGLFAHFLSNYVGAPVVDKTGLTDLYTFNLKWGGGDWIGSALYADMRELTQDRGDLFSSSSGINWVSLSRST